MTKTKTRDEVMSEAYWTPKEKEDLNSKYSTSLVKENCNQEEMKDKSLPSDAYIVTVSYTHLTLPTNPEV